MQQKYLTFFFITIILSQNINAKEEEKKALSPQAIAYSQDGKYLVTANQKSNNISVFKVDNITGKIIELKDSPIKVNDEPVFAIFSPVYSNGLQLLGITNQSSNNLSIFKVEPLLDRFTLIKKTTNTDKAPVSLAFTSNLSGISIAATANQNADNISVYKIDKLNGEFTQINNSPFKTEKSPQSITFCPANSTGIQIAVVANQNSNNISIFKVDNLTGDFKKFDNSPVNVGQGPVAVACSPEYFDSGVTFVAVANQYSDNVSIYRLGLYNGQLTQVNKSPYQTGKSPVALAFSPEYSVGFRFIAVTNQDSNNISIFKVNTLTGEINPVPKPLLSTGQGPGSIAFSPEYATGMKFAAVANQFSNNISIYRIDSVGLEFKEITGSPFPISR